MLKVKSFFIINVLTDHIGIGGMRHELIKKRLLIIMLLL